jgi:hypothetical protein
LENSLKLACKKVTRRSVIKVNNLHNSYSFCR